VGAQIEKLQAKYDTLANKQKAEDGEEVTQAYYVIKAAQEREELQRKGDELDTKIRKVRGFGDLCSSHLYCAVSTLTRGITDSYKIELREAIFKYHSLDLCMEYQFR
jgi:hypothetical protein